MGRYKKLISIISLSVMVLSLSIVASAQWRDHRGNGGYYGNGRYNSNLKSSIKNLRDNSRKFEDVLDRELDRSRYDGSRREDNLNRLADKFKNAAEDLDDEYEGRRSMRNSTDEARRVMNYGSQLDRALSRSRLSRNRSSLRSYWRNIERDLRTISRAYNINYNGRYGRNNGRYGRNDDRYGRNDRNHRNRRNRRRNRNGQYNKGNLRSTIVNLKYKSERFEDRIDRERNNRYGRRTSKNLENLSDKFLDAVKDLEDEYDDRDNNNDSYKEVTKVLRLGQQIDREVSRSRVDRSLRNDWNSIERDLKTLSRAYNVSYNGRSGGYSRIGDIIRNFPF